jgi:hypothetical protein
LDTRLIVHLANLDLKDEVVFKGDRLSNYEEQLQTMLEQWTELLLNNFKDKEVKANISLLSPVQQNLIKELLDKGEFTLPIDNKLIEAIKLLLQGIEKVEIKLEELKELMGNGSPMTVEDIRFRFEQMLKQKVGTNQTSRVRIMLEHEQKQ